MAAVVAVSTPGDRGDAPAPARAAGSSGEQTAGDGGGGGPPPVLFLYNHLHDAIRAELDALSSSVLALDASGGGDAGVEAALLRLKARYRFLEQVYKYHSAVEDEVVYPALDSKVKNVTSAYTVEHQDEEYLFEQLGQLLSSAVSQSGAERAATVRQLVCKVEAIHTTLRKHLAKEEAQLLPLLLHHFTYPEQAELVAQFLYCIPLDTVERVVSWLRPAVPPRELQQLLRHLRNVVPDNLLLQLLVAWLNPPSGEGEGGGEGGGEAGGGGERDGAAAGAAAAGAEQPAAAGGAADGAAAAPAPAAAQPWPPLKGIVLFHASIRGALEAFATEAAALQSAPGGVSPAQLAGLVERHRFLRSVCSFHTYSEEEVLFPEVIRLSRAGGGVDANNAAAAAAALQSAARAACSACQQEHADEVSLFEELGRLLADVRALARRGRREAGGMLGQLVDASRRVCAAISAHMRREEADVLPLLAAALPPDEQRGMVWRTLRAMPLRLLERVMPWLVAKLSAADAEGLISSLRLAAPKGDRQVVELLLRWAERGRWAGGGDAAAADGAALWRGGAAAGGDGGSEGSSGSGGGGGEDGQPGSDDPGLFSNNTCSLRAASGDADGAPPRKRPRASSADGSSGEAAAAQLPQQQQHHHHQQQQHHHHHHHHQQPPSQLQQQQPAPRWLEAHRAEAHCGCGADADAPRGSAKQQQDGGAAAAPLSDPQQQQQQQQQRPRRAATPGSPSAAAAARQPPPAQPPPPPPARAPSPLSGVKQRQASAGVSPIDHIFQFHKALRQELRQLEADAAELEAVVFSDPAAAAAGADAAAAGGAAGGGFRRCYAAALQQLDGRFQFLRGIYRAHSRSEDEIVFPALESKEALHNISHAYTLDHAQEENLFVDLDAIIARMQRGLAAWKPAPAPQPASAAAAAPAPQPPAADAAAPAAAPPAAPAAPAAQAAAAAAAAAPAAECPASEARELVLQLRRMCAAVRASLETHVRAEEAELWPLFAEHFTFEEQQHLVGVIIGRTGAEVLQALLPWVTGSFSEEEAGAMMESLRAATRNTSFDRWLGATMTGGGVAGGGAAAAAAAGPAQGGGGGGGGARELDHSSLAEIAEYLAAGDGGVAADADPDPDTDEQQQQEHGGQPPPRPRPPPPQLQEASGTVAESSSFRPGWEEIFDINQKQLEVAIRRVSNDPSLEPQRKSYLIQNIMVSRYIVAQQRRMRAHGTPSGTPLTAPQPGSAPPATPLTLPAAGEGGGEDAAGAAAQQQQPEQQQLQQQQQQQPQQQQQVEGHQPTYFDAANGVMGCRHYRRRAQLVAPCCGKAFTCRLCHDEASDHRMDRYSVAEMVCMPCGLRQPVAAACARCGEGAARYYCSICHLFDDEPGRSIYHCPFCNVCRRGQGLGVDFFHCMQCNACMSLSLFNQHTCRERAMEGNCPVCHEYLFDSHAPIKELPCGHFLHSSCFAQYTRYNYTCPVCCKSMGDMSVYFKMIDSLLAAEAARLPPQYAGRTQAVLCHDCGRSGPAPWHWVYHPCQFCHSYNTRVL
ncbi:hypothetical protein Rsub_08627 [Raphidocelis subcapitata]|uniref:Zinc finger protein n=1 Tax=Raphidocelis subcapitata TaxID=307507 RepID=A0A2V0PEX6_9CHLO|nr:hypothetical protein Rsub_08627 [Raphidocelis subcapitata]|eukprot:GBF95645.1 hypothetical protein Rsub_08627 [Raphidocelis subcapitata]